MESNEVCHAAGNESKAQSLGKNESHTKAKELEPKPTQEGGGRGGTAQGRN
jgi:hypothetical protein